ISHNRLRQRAVKQGTGFVVGLAGVIVVIARGEIDNLAGLQIHIGDLVILIGVLAWAIYSVLIKRYPLPMHPMSLLTTIFIIGTLGIAPFFAWEVARGGVVHLNWPGFAAVVYGAVCMSILSYMFFIRGVQALGPNKANAFGYLAPFFAALLAVLLLDEPVRGYHFAGFILICSGVYLTTAGRRHAV
ncbi:MAG: DMT family transporter, partial [Proteobacteria bacterium]|nr:DMT family transporter [Pseudomonadota bacterium]